MANRFTSALGAVFKALRATLSRKGVNVGGTADYPRVEIHSIIESEYKDKGEYYKVITCVVECVSDKRMQDVMDMNQENLSLMLAKALNLGDSWRVFGVVAGQLQELNEISESNAVIYRLLQNMTIHVERID